MGNLFDVTGENIRRIENQALRKLKHVSRSKILKKYLMSERIEGITTQTEIIKNLYTELDKKDEKIRNLEMRLIEAQMKCPKGIEELTEMSLGLDKDTQHLVNQLSYSVDDLELSVRAANVLRNAKIKYLGELVQKTDEELLHKRNFGRKSLNEIKEVLSGMNLHLGMKGIEEEYLINGKITSVPNEIFEKGIDELGLTPRLLHILYSNYTTIRDIIKESEEELFKFLKFEISIGYSQYKTTYGDYKKAESLAKEELVQIKYALANIGLRLGLPVYRFKIKLRT